MSKEQLQRETGSLVRRDRHERQMPHTRAGDIKSLIPGEIYTKEICVSEEDMRLARDQVLGATIAEGRELFKQAKAAGEVPEGYSSEIWGKKATAARDELVEAYIAIPKRLIRRYVWMDIDLEDLKQEACIRLVVAAERYDPSKGEFEHYATSTIFGTLQKVVARELPLIHISHEVTDNRALVMTTDRELEQRDASLPSDALLAEAVAQKLLEKKLKRAPTEEELQEELARILPDIPVLRRGQYFASLDATGNEALFAEEQLVSPEDVVQTAEHNLYLSEVFEALYGSNSITPKQKVLLLLNWIDELNTAEIARVLEISQPYVYQTIKRARERGIMALQEKGLIP